MAAVVAGSMRGEVVGVVERRQRPGRLGQLGTAYVAFRLARGGRRREG